MRRSISAFQAASVSGSLACRSSVRRPTSSPTFSGGQWRVSSTICSRVSGTVLIIVCFWFGFNLRRRRVWHPGRGMTAGVNLLKLFDRDFGVNRRRVELLVSEQLLDEADVGPVFEHVRGATVAQHVAATFAFEPGLPQPGGHHARDDVGIEGLAVAGGEQ